MTRSVGTLIRRRKAGRTAKSTATPTPRMIGVRPMMSDQCPTKGGTSISMRAPTSEPPPQCNVVQRPLQADRTTGTGVSSRPWPAPSHGQEVRSRPAALDLYRRAWIPEQSFEVSTKYLALADKAARTVATLSEALDRHRGRGQQQITVKHVSVHADQAVVADNV